MGRITATGDPPDLGAAGVTPVIRPPGNWRRGYASDLNPVEGLLASFEGVELANLAADTVQKVTTAAERGIRRIRGTRAPGLLVPTSLRLILAGPRLSTPATDHQVVSVAKSHARRAERIDHPFVAFDR